MAFPRRPRARAEQVSDIAWAMMTDQPVKPGTEREHWQVFCFEHIDRDLAWGPSLRSLWADYRSEILAAWIVEHPGTRPSCWWRFDAPEPRREPPPPAEQARYLAAHNLLEPAERRRRGGRSDP